MNVLKPNLQTTIWTLLNGGATQREIEWATDISRQSIQRYQQSFAADPANCLDVATHSQVKLLHPGYWVARQLRHHWPPLGANPTVPSSTPSCGWAATPQPLL